MKTNGIPFGDHLRKKMESYFWRKKRGEGGSMFLTCEVCPFHFLFFFEFYLISQACLLRPNSPESLSCLADKSLPTLLRLLPVRLMFQ